MSKRQMAMDVANWYVNKYSRQELEQYCFDRMTDELERDPKLKTKYTDMLVAKQDLADHMEPELGGQ